MDTTATTQPVTVEPLNAEEVVVTFAHNGEVWRQATTWATGTPALDALNRWHFDDPTQAMRWETAVFAGGFRNSDLEV